ncbi:P2Y purinoceptor 11 [Protopterus annectens]|uniref:P2Y purinoceptor 11 n=1 Tax=Protopterus annectens TaxID=7888 RepID=UPI001CF9ACED|nr:P2Y purinoceptor 11 [Protopterus annectens]
MNGNVSNCSSSNVVFAVFQQRYLPPMFGVEFLLAVTWNSLAIWLFFTREKNWHSGIIYSFNLAMADLLYALSLPLLITYYAWVKNWTYGKGLCKLERFVFNSNLYGSIFFITCISLNRYIGIVHPFFAHSNIEPKHAKIISVIVWMLVFVINLPVLVFSTIQPTLVNNATLTECIGSAVDVRLKDYIPYSLFMAVFACGLPFIITFSCYVAIVWTVYKNENITLAEKKKIGAMIFIVVSLYAISYVPYVVLRNINLYRRTQCNDTAVKDTSVFIHSSYQVTKGLVTLNMCIHPLLYAAVTDSMRTLCAKCVGKKPVRHSVIDSVNHPL